MEISRSHVEHIARLARITLTHEQQERFASQLSSIFGYIEKLNSVDVSHVEATSQVTGLANISRSDTIASSPLPDELIAAAPQSSGRQIKVKAILED